MQVKIKQISGLQDIIDTPVSMGVAYSQSFNILSPSTGDNFETGVSMDFTPFTDSVIKVDINGLLEEGSYVDKLGAFYFSNDGGVTVKSVANLESGDKLYWNGLIKGYQLGPQDFITISYEKEYLSYGSISGSASTPISGIISVLDLGDTTSSTTTIDLSVADNQKIRITEDTKLNFINGSVGKKYTIIPYINQQINPTVTYSSNVIFDGNLTKSIIVSSRIDSSFVVGTGFSLQANQFGQMFYPTPIIQSDGKIVVIGGLTSYNGVVLNRIVRLNIDGSIDTSFVYGTGFNTSTGVAAIQSDDKILISGGGFGSYKSVATTSIIRLNTDGSLDTTFIGGTGFTSNSVKVILVQSDGKIIIGGTFNTYKDLIYNVTLSYKNIIRLNTDGSIDLSFAVGEGFNSTVNAASLQSDGKIILLGAFTTYQGVSSPYIIRLNSDGSIDTSFVVDTGFNSSPSTCILQSDGRILVSGGFTTYQGVNSNRVIRLNSDGSIDTSFVVGAGFNSTVFSIALQSDDKILAVGQFTTYQGVSSNRVIRLNSDGSIDTSFVVGTGFNSTVISITPVFDNKFIIGGAFNSYQGVSSPYIIKFNQTLIPIYYKLNLVSDGTNLIID